MKIKGKGLVLPISVMVIFAIVFSGVGLYLKNKDASAAKKVNATATANISVLNGEINGKINPRSNALNYIINIKLNERAEKGDYVDYYIENLPDVTRGGSDIYTQNNVHIGKVYFLKGTRENKRIKQTSNTSKDSEEKQNLTPGSVKAGCRIIFSEAVEQFENVEFSISNTGFVPYTLSKDDFSAVSKVVFENKEIASKSLTVSKATEVKINSLNVTSSYAALFRNKDGLVSSNAFGYTLDIPRNSLLKGDILTYDLSGTALRYNNLGAVGSRGRLGRSPIDVTAGQEYNSNGLYLFGEVREYEYEIIEHTPEVLKVKLLDDIDETGLYRLSVGGVDVVDASAINLNNSTVSFSNILSQVSDEKDNGSKYTKRDGKFTMNYAGSKMISSDQIQVVKSSVFAKYVDENGKEIAAKKTIADNAKYGTDYSDSGEIKIDGYEFVELAKDSASQTGKVSNLDKTIVYVYRKLPAPTKEEAKEVEKHQEAPKTEIQAPNTGFEQNVGISFFAVAVLAFVSVFAIKKLTVSKIKF